MAMRLAHELWAGAAAAGGAQTANNRRSIPTGPTIVFFMTVIGSQYD
jgi:hypothetical protein